MAVSANRLELLQIADAVAREKSIDRGIVIAAMEDAIQKAARSRYGSETEVRAEINPKTGEMRLSRLLLVVELVETSSNQITLEEARKRNPAAQVGDFIAEALPPLEYGRIAAQSAKQVIVQKVREAERDRQYAEYKDRIGDIVNGIVKRVEYGNVVVDLGRGEAIVRRDELLPREVFRNGDRIRAYIYDVRREPRGPQIFLSRTHPQFTAKLFAQEVPEIYDGIVEVKAVARDPGSRAKIAVISRDSSVDPVGACVGMRGSRVQAVVNELQGEKIDIIPWSPNIATFVVNALAPAEVAKVVIDEDRERIEVVVPDTNNQLSLAIGRRGQNVRLASQLTGWDIDILTEQEESERRQADFENSTRVFMEALNVDEVVGQLLASEGFTSVEELALVDVKELASIEGFDDETANELQSRAREYLEQLESELENKRRELGVDDALKSVPGVTSKMLVKFGENDIKTVEDLAGCATDDLVGWTERKEGGEPTKHPGILDPNEVSRDDAENMIMQARVIAGWITEADLAKKPEPTEAAEDQPVGPPCPATSLPSAMNRGRNTGFAQPPCANDRSRVTRMLAFADPDLDNGPRTDRSATMRMCAVTRAVRPIGELIRFVVSPQGEVMADLKRKLPGRGLWVSASHRAVAEAVRRHQFSKGFKRDVRVAPTLVADTEALLVRSAVEALAMAAKAGQVVSGFSKVEDALRPRQAQTSVQALIHAADGAADGIRKLDAMIRQNAGINDESREIPVVTALTSEQLDLALGRSNVIHAALLAGPASKSFLTRSQILVRYRMADDDRTAGDVAQNSPIQTVRTRTKQD